MPKIKVVVDLETRSPVDLPKQGRMNYIKHPHTDILMMGYRYVAPGSQAILWLPGMTLPDFCVSPHLFTIYAHNAEFEHGMMNNAGVRKHGMAPTLISNFICSAALCGRYGIPQRLEKAGEVLKLKMQKDPEGKQLIKLFCTPEYGFGRDANNEILPMYRDKWERFKLYCLRDVDAEYELIHTLPSDRLSPDEYKAWVHSCTVNARGLPVDIDAVKQIRRVAELYREAHFELLPELTNNAITRVTQTQRIVKYCNERGVALENCQADTVQKMLERDDLPDDVLMLLEMRAQLGLSSIGKYVRFEEMNYAGRIYDNQRYYGAHTGRWTGGGVQLLNLPRASVNDPDAEIARYFDGSIVDDGRNPVKSARALIRPMIKAPEGKVMTAADYSAIEYVMLEWFAGDQAKLDRFASGADQYKDQAVAMYGINYDAVTDEQRRGGKVVVLACGYQQGANKLVVTADKQFGIKLTFEEADFLVRGYRKNHAAVVSMWYALSKAALGAVQQPGVPFATHKVVFKVVTDRVGTPWLSLTLPSGRVMYYNRPFVGEGKFGPVPCHWGFHQTSQNWLRMELIPGRITENIVQAAARDILVHGMLTAEAHGFQIGISIYDEVVCEIEDRDHEEQLALLCKCLCATQPWSAGIPLRAEGFVGKRYKKM